MSDDVLTRAKAEIDPDARMDAYYYGFDRTNIGVIDSVLSEVAIAGKAYHGTDYWTDEYDEKYFPSVSDRRSHEERIQGAANDSAAIIRELIALAETQARKLDEIQNLCQGPSQVVRKADILAILDGNQT